MRIVLIALISMFATQLHAASKSQIIAECKPAIEKQNVELAKSTSVNILLVRKISRSESREIGVNCLNLAFGDGWFYDEATATFNNLSEEIFSTALSSLTKPERRKYDKLTENIKSQGQTTSDNQKKLELGKANKAVSDRLEALRQQKEELNAKNKALIDEDTYKACLRLYQTDELAPFLNPICQKIFTQYGHPKLER